MATAADAALLALASSTIEEEIRECFQDTALYKRLCWAGPKGLREVNSGEQPSIPSAADQNTADAAAAAASPNHEITATRGSPDTDSPAGRSPACSPTIARKRRRLSLVEELQKDIMNFTTVASPAMGEQTERAAFDKVPPRGSAFSTGYRGEADTNFSPAASGYTTTNYANGDVNTEVPFSVALRSCSTKVIDTYPCWVLKGYIVLWAESVLEIDFAERNGATGMHLSERRASIRTPAAAGQPFPDHVIDHRTCVERSSTTDRVVSPSRTPFSFSLPPMGLRPLLHRLTSAFTTAPSVQQSLTSVCREEGVRNSSRLNTVSVNRKVTEGSSITLHSMHIVNSDAVSHFRPASFALQSLLQPGQPTALECYPRHMMYFGTLVYAAWHASSSQWSILMTSLHDGRLEKSNGCKCAAAATPQDLPSPWPLHSSAALAKGSSSHNQTDTLRALLPHTPRDAVLVLGLGGNVLGQCLDALLPAAVPLHIVEVEPAVFQACYAHQQFPTVCRIDNDRADAASTLSASIDAVTPSVLSSRSPRRKKPAASSELPLMPPLMGTVPDASLWREAAKRIQRNSGAPVVIEATRCATLRDSVPSSNLKTVDADKGNSSVRFRHPVEPHGVSSRNGEYRCYLQDAYAFLRDGVATHAGTEVGGRTKTVERLNACAPASIGSNKHAASKSAFSSASCDQLGACDTAVASLPIQYSMIFLDCYDPDREHMMHEGTLVELCARRLQPGGVLLVNAHVLPTAANLKRDFLAHGFATVQALRVSGCVQTILVCVARDMEAKGICQSDSSDAAAANLAEKRSRLTVGQLRRLAETLNRSFGFSSPENVGIADMRSSPESMSVSAAERAISSRPTLFWEEKWLKSCRRVPIPCKGPFHQAKQSNSQSTSSAEADVLSDTDLQVWLHRD